MQNEMMTGAAKYSWSIICRCTQNNRVIRNPLFYNIRLIREIRGFIINRVFLKYPLNP